MRKDDELILPRWAPYLVLLPIAVIAVDGVLDWAFGWRDPIGDVRGDVPNPRLEAMGRSRVLAALLPFMLVAALMATQFARDFTSLFGPGARKKLLTPILVFALAAAVVTLLQTRGYNAPDEAIGQNFIDTAFAKATTIGLEWSLVETLDTLVAIFRIFLVLGAGAAIVGTISCLAEPDPALPLRTQRRYRDAQQARLDGWLYASALLLVTGLFFVDSCMRWPAPFSTDRALFLQHVEALILADGIFYSTIIASYYIPVAVLTGRFADRAGPAGVATGGEDGASAAGLIKAFVALLSPAAAGLLTQLIQGLGT